MSVRHIHDGLTPTQRALAVRIADRMYRTQEDPADAGRHVDGDPADIAAGVTALEGRIR